MQNERLFYENSERRKNYMLRMFFSKLCCIALFMVLAGAFVFSITNRAKAGGVDFRPSNQAPVVVEADNIVVCYWDLRDRDSFCQVTNVSGGPITVHIQIWNDADPSATDPDICTEFDFPDSYTGNDTHIYRLADLTTNDGSEIFPPDLTEGLGYMFISVTGGPGCSDAKVLMANHRIVDIPGGYEYRSAAPGLSNGFKVFEGQGKSLGIDTDTYGFNFNSENGASFSDVIPIHARIDSDPDSGVCRVSPRFSGVAANTVTLNENRQSCPFRNVGCRPEPEDDFDTIGVNVGINNFFLNSRGETSICNDSNPNGWFIIQLVENFLDSDADFVTSSCYENNDVACGGLIGINNGDGTGSMEAWTALDRRLGYLGTEESD